MSDHVHRPLRMKTLLSARVRAGRLRAESCVIENVSAGGAKLRLRTPVSLPETFCVDILKWRETYRVRLIWRVGLAAGVQFCELLEWAQDAPSVRLDSEHPNLPE